MNKVTAIFFSISCFATSALSNSIMGVGMWFWIIISTGIFVGISQFLPKLRGAGAIMALILSIISICAVLFGLVAATIGGSFKLEDKEALLLFLFFLISVSGAILARMHRNSPKHNGSLKA